MARPVNPDSQYTIKPHIMKGLTYASTQPSVIDAATGKKKYHYIHWGRIEDCRFIPNQTYILASPEERAKLLFPEGLDMSMAQSLSGARKPGRPTYEGEDRNRLYGDIWLLEQIADKTGIRQDLMKVFDDNGEIVNDILTLSYFPYLTGYTYNRVSRWQRITKAPSDRDLTPTYITRLTQSITERHRMDLLRFRALRLGKDVLCAVDSSTRSAYGSSLSDIHWGKNKEDIALEDTVEVVVYALTDHMPVYYRTFPGNFPDSRSLETILTDLDHAGFNNLILITDRGYESIQNLEKYILKEKQMIMCAKTGQSMILKKIMSFGSFDGCPAEMVIDPDTQLYSIQYDEEYEVKSTGSSSKKANLGLNLYLDSVRRSEDLRHIDSTIALQRKELDQMLAEHAILDDDATIKRKYRFFTISYNDGDRAITAYLVDEKKVTKAKLLAGFFAIITHGVEGNAMDIFRAYRLRDEQEKYFQQMKSQMVCDRQRNWSEEGKTGRLFILYVSMIISSYLRHIWKSTELHELFSSSLEILDEMRPIRCIEHTNKAKFITPFVGKQVDICLAFGFDIPKGCEPTYISKQKFTRKRGRPAKPKIETYL